MKKAFCILGFIVFGTAFSQVTVTPETIEIEHLYKGGTHKFVKDVQNNFATFSSEFQVNGRFILTFEVDKKGKIINPKVLPEVNNDFAFAVIRSFKRVKNNFEVSGNNTKIKVLLDFSPNFKSDDGRERFTEPTSAERFNNR